MTGFQDCKEAAEALTCIRTIADSLLGEGCHTEASLLCEASDALERALPEPAPSLDAGTIEALKNVRDFYVAQKQKYHPDRGDYFPSDRDEKIITLVDDLIRALASGTGEREADPILALIDAHREHPFIAKWTPAEHADEIIGDLLDEIDRLAAAPLPHGAGEKARPVAAPQASGEPVAWQRKNRLLGWSQIPDDMTSQDGLRAYREAGQEIRPLYAAPVPSTDGLREALRPLAILEIPKNPQGNAGFYSIRHADIERAAAALALSDKEGKA